MDNEQTQDARTAALESIETLLVHATSDHGLHLTIANKHAERLRRAFDASDDAIDLAAHAMGEYLAIDHDIDNTGDGESIFIFYGASGGGSIEINLRELARIALEQREA